MDNSIEKMEQPQKPNNFAPLFLIFGGILVGTLLIQVIREWHFHEVMADFMGIFFIVFGSFKLLGWKDFITAFRQYDIIAKQCWWYAALYPLIEIGLGVAYLTRFYLVPVNIITLALMVISSIGVILALFKKEQFQCACLGTIVKVPLTYLTLLEDVIMGIMALAMLIKH